MKGRTFIEIEPGERIVDTLTVTDYHIFTAAGLFKDFNPVHVNEAFGRASRFKSRITHGALTAGIMIGVLGNYLAGTALALVEQMMKFKAPVLPGDTLTTEWQVESKEYKEKLDGGFITFKGLCRNQRNEVVVEGQCKFLVSAQHLPA